MLKRENDFEKDKKMEEMNSKYNLEELFQEITSKKEEEKEKKSK